MRPVSPIVVLALAAGLALSACSGDDGSSGPSPHALGSGKVIGPCPQGSEISGGYFPPVTLDPAGGPMGTRVQISGEGFRKHCWPYGAGRQSVFLNLGGGGAPKGCNLFVEFDQAARVDGTGHLSGHFDLPPRGFCRQDTHEPPRQPRLVAGQYLMSMGCTACGVASFTVTKE